MRILAIDPGTNESGIVILDGMKVLAADVMDNERLLYSLNPHEHPEDVARTADEVPTILAIEMIASYGMPVGREVFETCVWIGCFKQAWAMRKPSPGPVQLIYRKDVKMHLCGTAKAKDPNVWQALLDLFGGESAVGRKASPGPLYGVKSHARAALAVAVTARDRMDGWKTAAPAIAAKEGDELPF